MTEQTIGNELVNIPDSPHTHLAGYYEHISGQFRRTLCQDGSIAVLAASSQPFVLFYDNCMFGQLIMNDIRNLPIEWIKYLRGVEAGDNLPILLSPNVAPVICDGDSCKLKRLFF